MFRPGTADDRIRLACLHAGEPVHENAGSRGGCPRWLLVEGAGQHPRRHSATSVESVGVFMDLTPASATAAPMSRLWDPGRTISIRTVLNQQSVVSGVL